MRKAIIIFLLFFIGLIELGCETDAKNYKDAYIVTRNDTIFIKLKGKRVPLHNSGTYEDSTLIPIPTAGDGRVEGKDIPVMKGHFNFSGYILINKNILIVKLLVDDTTDNNLRSLSWNGEYNLIR